MLKQKNTGIDTTLGVRKWEGGMMRLLRYKSNNVRKTVVL